MPTKTLGSVIKSRREKLEYSERRLANAVGVDKSYISKIENHNLIPSYHIIVKLETVLGVKIQDFYLKEKKMAPDLLLTTPSGQIIVAETKTPSLKKREFKKQEKDYIAFLDKIVTSKEEIDPKKIAYSFVIRFAPQKAKDKELINELAGSIDRLRNFRSRLLQLTK